MDVKYPEFYAVFRSEEIFQKRCNGKRQTQKLFFLEADFFGKPVFRNFLFCQHIFLEMFLQIFHEHKFQILTPYFGKKSFYSNVGGIFCIFLHENMYMSEIRNAKAKNNKKRILYFGHRNPPPIQKSRNNNRSAILKMTDPSV